MMKYGTTVAYTLLATIIIVVDRVTKVMALSCLAQPKRITSFLEFNLVLNRGITWGIFHSMRTDFFWIITAIITCMIIILAGYSCMRYLNQQSIWAEVAVLAGACSNLIDRIVYGGVIDFIHFSYERWSWPIFNVADVAIVIGIALMIYQYND